MKKRILSFLLVLCTILTMIPVMASAAEEPEAVVSDVESTNADYAKLYVQAGLVHAYMAFGKSDASYDLANGVWYDLVGKANAAITGGAYDASSNPTGWKVGDNGGLVYEDNDAVRATGQSIRWTVGTGEGQLNLPEKYTVEYLSRTEMRDIAHPWVDSALTVSEDGLTYTAAVSKWNANLGKVMVTFKGAASTKYTVNCWGTAFEITTDAEGNYTSYGSYSSGKTALTITVPAGLTVAAVRNTRDGNAGDADQAFAFGNLRALVWSSTMGSNSWGNGCGSVRWFAAKNGWGGGGSGCTMLVSEDRTFVAHDGRSLAMTVTKDNYALTDKISETYTVSYGGAKYTYTPAADHANGGNLSNATAAFRVQANLPGAVYSLRMYEGAIDEATQKQNHFVDILAYTRYDIAKYQALSAETKAALYDFFADAAIDGKTAADIDVVIARVEGKSYLANTLYVEDGLVSLFLPSSIDITNKVWYNLVEGGNNATLKGSRWYENTDGTIAINGNVLGTQLPNGALTGTIYGTKLGTTFDMNNVYMDLGIASLPDSDFTVSMTASYKNIQAYDYLTGKLTGSWATARPEYSEQARYCLGLFMTWNNLVGTGGAARYGYISNNPTADAWRFTADNGTTARGWQRCGDWGGTMGGDRTNFKSKLDKGFYTESITRDEVVVSEEQTNATYAIWQGASKVNEGTFKSNNSGHPMYLTDESMGRFALFCNWAADVVSVSVYDRVLSPAEMKQNHVADVAVYYSLDVSSLLKAGNEVAKEAFISLSDALVIDPDNYAANKAAYQSLIDSVAAEKSAYDKLYETEGLIGLYTMFDADEATNVLASKIWKNKVDGGVAATVKGPAYAYDAAVNESWGWKVGAHGGIGVSYTRNVWRTYVNGKNSDSANFTSISLATSLLDNDALQVEFVGTIEPIVNLNGTFFETNVTLDKYGMYNSSDATFSIGHWRSTSFIAKGHGGASFGQDRWSYHWAYWANHNGNSYGGVTPTFRANLAMEDVITFSMAQTITRVEGGTAKSAISLTLNNNSTWNAESNGGWFDEPEKGKFALLNGLGGSVYAVRVYDRVLTDAEENANHFADLLAYHKVDSALVSKLTPEQIAIGAATYASVPLNKVSETSLAIFVKALTGEAAKETLYVQNGLVGLYTAYNGDISVDLAAGKWINKVDGTAITLAGTWKTTENGAITNGPMYYGRANYVDNYYGGQVALRDTSKYNNWTHANYVDFGIDMLPDGDYTIEIVNKTDEIKLLADDGTAVPYRNYTATYWYKVTENGATTTQSFTGAQTSTDTVTYELIGVGYTTANGYINNSLSGAIGNIKLFLSAGGYFEGDPNYAYRWYLSKGNGGWGSFGYGFPIATGDSTMEDKSDKFSVIPGEVQTRAITREMVYENESLTTVNVGVYRNFAKLLTGIIPTDTSKGNGNYWPEEDETVFYLFKNESVDLYSIRIYDRILTADEMAQNRAADVISFYNLDLTKYNNYTDELKAKALDAMANFGFEEDAADVQAVLDSIAGYVVDADGKTAYDKAYVQDGLVGLYTAFGGYDASLDFANGIWNNKVAGQGYAVLVANGYSWQKNAKGGIYFNTTLERFDNNGNVRLSGVMLPDAFAELDNFTVETVYKTIGLLDANGNVFSTDWADKKTDANGVTIPQSGYKYGNYQVNLAPFRFGMLNAFGFVSRRANNDNNQLGMFRWYVSNYMYNAHGGASGNSSIFFGVGTETANFNNAWKSATNSYSKVTAADGVTYTIGLNGSTSLKATVPTDKYNELLAQENEGGYDSDFSLFNGYPAEVYVIRVYNRTLTEAEYLQNHFVDMAAYFGLDLSKLSANDAATVYAAFKDINTQSDATYAHALYGFYTGDKDELAGTLGSHEGYAPLLGDEAGYRVYFGIEKSAYDLFASGYTINYGAIVAVGEWGKDTINTIDGLTVNVSKDGKTVTTSANNAKVVVVGGTANGKELYYEKLGDKMVYSVSVTAGATEYGAGILVRGFYTITDAQGNSYIHYMEAAEDATFTGAVSVMEVADYYVNKFDGNVATAYQYMQAPGMLKVLDACGIEARTGLGGDLTIYVEEDGSDDNNGLSKDTAFATVEAAFAAAKAHLATDAATGVTIEIGAGEFFVAEPLSMNGAEFGKNVGSVIIRGQGDATVLTGAVKIDGSNFDDSDSEFGEMIINLADENGNVPQFRYLYKNGERMEFVKAGDEENYFNVGTVTVDAEAKTAKFYMDPTYINSDYDFIGTEVHILVEWNFNIIHVVDVDVDDTDKNGNVAVYVDYDQFSNMAVYNTVNNREYWLENGYGLLANASVEGVNGYYYDEKTGNLHILDDEFDADAYSYAGVENAFIFNNVDGLKVENLSITGIDNKYVKEESGLKGGQAGNNGRTEEGTLVGGGFLTLAAVYGNNVTNSVFSGLNIYNVAGDGINLRGRVENVQIVSNKIQHVGETAIRIGANNGSKTAHAYNKDITIANNYINGTGEFFKQCCGMLITNGANISILGNTIQNTTYTAISIGWVWSATGYTLNQVLSGANWNLVNVEVAYNYMSDIMTCMRDGGAIYILGGNAAIDVENYFNYMHDNYLVVTEQTGLHDGQRWFMGYYHDGSGSNWYDYNNVVVNNTTSGVSNFVPYYVQGIASQLSYNVKLYGNYAIGFANGEALYRRADRIVAERNIVANDYIFTNSAMTKYVAGDKFGNSESLTPPSDAKAQVHSIFLTAGSSLTNTEIVGCTGAAGGSKGAYDLVFAGGKADLGSITGNLEAPKFAVSIVVEGEVIKTIDVAAGEAFTMPEDVAEPTKDRGEHSSFVFAGWKNYTPGMEIVSNVTIEATFEEVIDLHKVTLIKDGETLAEIEVPYGALIGDYIPEEFAAPEKEMTVNQVFKFKGWYTTNDVTTGYKATETVCEGDSTIYALYDISGRLYNVKLVVKNPTTGEYDVIATVGANYNQDDQFRQGDRFTIYAGEFKDVNKAQFDEFMAQYWPADTDLITYSYSNRFVLKEGEGRFYYVNDAREAEYTLWRLRVTTACVFELVFDENYKVNINGEEATISNVAPIDFTKAYAKEGYNVTGVTIGGEAVEDMTAFVATADIAGKDIEIAYERISYTVTFMVGDEVYKTMEVFHGETLVLPDAPADFSDDTYNYTFEAWVHYTEGMVVTGPATFIAKFSATEKPAEPEYIEGDIDGDGVVKASDVDWLFQIIAGTLSEDAACANPDLDGDGVVKGTDVDLLFQIIANQQ